MVFVTFQKLSHSCHDLVVRMHQVCEDDKQIVWKVISCELAGRAEFESI